MTTDITELAQSLKRRAASANEFGESLYVKADDVLALVEALEKAERANGYLREQSAEWERKAISNFEECARLSHRIDELLPSSRNMLMPALDGLSRYHLVDTIQTAVDNHSALHTKWLEDRQRIAELEEAEQKLCAANVTLDARAELAERQLAEMVSRTVKLPEGLIKAVSFYEQVKRENTPVETGVWKDAIDWVLKEATAAAGIKWEAE
nr:MAG TPA: hypothetical protein [Caudoviricetes sp.]